MTNFNELYFRRANRVLVATNRGERNFQEVASMDANLRKLGYALDDTLAYRLMNASKTEIAQIHDLLVKTAKEIKGVRRYSPMYPNFPRQVMEAVEAELYLNAIFHYFGTSVGINILPGYEKLARPELVFDESKVTFIRLGDVRGYYKLVDGLLGSKIAWSATDVEDIKSLDADTFHEVYRARREWPNRENKATIGAIAHRIGEPVDPVIPFDTATDVLRLAVALSDGDVSLAENTRFRNFRRYERRWLLGLLNEVKGDITEDMLRNASAWKRLGERLHPGEYSQFTKAAEGFAAIRENGAVEVFNSKVEKAIAEERYTDAAVILSARPGEFARRLDTLLRKSLDGDTILNLFSQVAWKVSPTVLVQARNAFANRAGKDIRVFFPKGSVAKMQATHDRRGGIRNRDIERVLNILDHALTQQFSERPDLGGSYVDPALKGIAIPFGMRSASKSVHTLGRGSRLSFEDGAKVIRFFIWWKDAESGGWGWGNHTDIDLSAVMYDENFGHAGAITYYNLRESGAVHSGDITSAPNGASEFIDIEVDKLRERGVRYVAMTLHSYSGQSFVELPECFAGFMERSDLDSGEIYDPRTVVNKADLTAESRGATPFIFDLETGEAIWVDLSMNIQGGYSNVASTKGQITTVVEAMASLTPPNMYDLFVAHATARGGLVTRDKAKTVFAFDGDVTPFDTELILDEYL